MEKQVTINVEVIIPKEIENLEDEDVKKYLKQIKGLIREAQEIAKAFNNRLAEIG